MERKDKIEIKESNRTPEASADPNLLFTGGLGPHPDEHGSGNTQHGLERGPHHLLSVEQTAIQSPQFNEPVSMAESVNPNALRIP